MNPSICYVEKIWLEQNLAQISVPHLLLLIWMFFFSNPKYGSGMLLKIKTYSNETDHFFPPQSRERLQKETAAMYMKGLDGRCVSSGHVGRDAP